MKTAKSLVVAASLCAVFSVSAFGATSQEQGAATQQQGQTMRLAYYYGGHCWWRHGVRYCNNYPYRYHRYHHRCYKTCWTGYYGRVHCQWHCR